jgi:hypothetical protein
MKMFMHNLLRYIVMMFALLCCFIALEHIAIGPAAIPGSIAVNTIMDNEDRFYATLFLGFGVAMFWCSRDLFVRRQVFGFLLLTFFAGGIARLISWAIVGPPSDLFIFLGALELILPPILWLWNERLRKNSEHK